MMILKGQVRVNMAPLMAADRSLSEYRVGIVFSMWHKILWWKPTETNIHHHLIIRCSQNANLFAQKVNLAEAGSFRKNELEETVIKCCENLFMQITESIFRDTLFWKINQR